MNPHDETYLENLRYVMENGMDVPDRTGTGTRTVFGRMNRYDLTKGFPLLTTKKVYWKKVVSELLWFIEGTGDERRLAEIHYGKPRSELEGKTTIWTENVSDPKWLERGKSRFEGDLGNVYGVMWRKWPAPIVRELFLKEEPGMVINGFKYPGSKITQTITEMTYLDQLTGLIEGIKKDPHGRRHILQAWNPAELPNQCLPPCHMTVQFRVTGEQRLSLMVYIRSNDLFLGQPFNIASYALFLMMVAQVCDMEAHEVIVMTGDTHLYRNHFDQAEEQLTRTSFDPPKVWLDPSIKDIDDFTMDSIKLIDYVSQPAIAASMAV